MTHAMRLMAGAAFVGCLVLLVALVQAISEYGMLILLGLLVAAGIIYAAGATLLAFLDLLEE